MKKKLKKIKTGKLLKQPKANIIKKFDPVKTVLKGTNIKMVTEGEEGYFKDEYEKERKNFLGGYNL